MERIRFNKDEMAKDIFDVYKINHLSERIKKIIIKEHLWMWSEFNGKFLGCPHWSEGAIKYMKENIEKQGEFLTKEQKFRKLWGRAGNKNKPNLTHEHAVPKSFAIGKFFDQKFSSESDVLNFMDKNAKGVIITEDERKIIDGSYPSDMPDSNEYDSFDRYFGNKIKTHQIKVYEIYWNKLDTLIDSKTIQAALNKLLTTKETEFGREI